MHQWKNDSSRMHMQTYMDICTNINEKQTHQLRTQGARKSWSLMCKLGQQSQSITIDLLSTLTNQLKQSTPLTTPLATMLVSSRRTFQTSLTSRFLAQCTLAASMSLTSSFSIQVVHGSGYRLRNARRARQQTTTDTSNQKHSSKNHLCCLK